MVSWTFEKRAYATTPENEWTQINYNYLSERLLTRRPDRPEVESNVEENPASASGSDVRGA